MLGDARLGLRFLGYGIVLVGAILIGETSIAAGYGLLFGEVSIAMILHVCNRPANVDEEPGDEA